MLALPRWVKARFLRGSERDLPRVWRRPRVVLVAMWARGRGRAGQRAVRQTTRRLAVFKSRPMPIVTPGRAAG